MILAPNQPAWYAEFAHLLENHTEGRPLIDSVSELVRQHLPLALYRYRAESSREHDNLRKHVLWFSSPERYNDPYDCAFKLGIDEVRKSIQRAAVAETLKQQGISPLPPEVKQVLATGEKPLEQVAAASPGLVDKEALLIGVERLLRRVQDFLDAIRGKVKACSFSERNDSVLMWSHYADQHKGFCVEYDTRVLAANQQMRLYPVLYSPQLFDVTGLATAFVTGLRDELPTGHTLLPILQKWDVWSYEMEWRGLTLLHPSGVGARLDNIRPNRIFLGAKMPDRNRERIAHSYKGKGIIIEQMSLSGDAFRLVSLPV
jgi:hypothetical protein